MANNGSEGDFDSILEDESLDSAPEDIEALNVLSDRFLMATRRKQSRRLQS